MWDNETLNCMLYSELFLHELAIKFSVNELENDRNDP